MAGSKSFGKVFLYDETLSLNEKNECINYVNKLGASSSFSETYESEATHVVVHDEKLLRESISPKVLGCLASGKSVVTIKYLQDSFKQGHFLDELSYINQRIRKIQWSVKKHGKSFRNLTCLVFLRSPKQREQFSRILTDGGANVHNWSVRDLSSKPTVQITNVNKIFTERGLLQNPEFQAFIANRDRAQWRIQILHYMYIFKFIFTEPSSKERFEIDRLFDIKNEAFMQKLFESQMRMIQQSRSNVDRIKDFPSTHSFRQSETKSLHSNAFKRKHEPVDDICKENKRPRTNVSGMVRTSSNIPSNVINQEIMYNRGNLQKNVKSDWILKAKKDNKGMIQMKIDSIPQFRIKREEFKNREPEIITLDEDEDIQVLQVYEKKPMSIRRVHSGIKKEHAMVECKPDIKATNLSKPSVIEVKRKIALDDDGMRHILPQLQRQNMCISSTLTNPVAPPTYSDVKPSMPFTLPPGISQYKNGHMIHDGRNGEHEVVVLDDSDEDTFPVDIKQNDEIIVLSSDDDEPVPISDLNNSYLAICDILENEKQYVSDTSEMKESEVSKSDEQLTEKSESHNSMESTQSGSIKIRSLKFLTGISPPKPKAKIVPIENKAKLVSDSQSECQVHPISSTMLFDKNNAKDCEKEKFQVDKQNVVATPDINKITESKIQPQLESILPPEVPARKTWGLPDEKCNEMTKTIWESDEEEKMEANDIDPDNDDFTTILISSTSKSADSDSLRNSANDVLLGNMGLTEEIMPSEAIDASVETASNNSIDTNAETVVDETEFINETIEEMPPSFASEGINESANISITKAANVDEIASPYLSKERSVNATDFLEDSSQINLRNIDTDSRKYIKALVNRQKQTDECIDVTNIRARTAKFDSKKESRLTPDELDERGRPRSETFDNYITTQLVETTINCTEVIGIAELLDITHALSSATCSKFYPRYLDTTDVFNYTYIFLE